MNERVVQIIVYLIGELKRNNSVESIDVHRLSTDGYTDAEIGTAWNWLMNKIALSTDTAPSRFRATSFRVLNDQERRLFRSEAYGYLLQLREFGILRETDFELLIDRAETFGYYGLGIPEIQTMVGMILIEQGDEHSATMQSQIKNLLGTVQ